MKQQDQRHTQKPEHLHPHHTTSSATLDGSKVTLTPPSTVTLAVALASGSATLVALTRHVAETGTLAGAVYVTVLPLPLILPHVAAHVTLESLAPETVAVKTCDPPGANVTLSGTTVTPTST